MIPYSFSLAALVMVGHSLGAGRIAEAKANCNLVAVTTTIISILLSISFFLTSTAIISLYT